MRMLLGLTAPTSGEVTIFGKPFQGNEKNILPRICLLYTSKGRHAFIVTTHTDKQHIHCHIYYNSTTLDCTRKFLNFWGSSFALRRLSDRLCLENGLSLSLIHI